MLSPAPRGAVARESHRCRVSSLKICCWVFGTMAALASGEQRESLMTPLGATYNFARHGRRLQQDDEVCTSGLYVQWSCTVKDNGIIETLVRNLYTSDVCLGDPVSSYRIPDLRTPDYFGCQDRKDLGSNNGFMLTCRTDGATKFLVYPNDTRCSAEPEGPFGLGCTCYINESDDDGYSDSDSDSGSDSEEYSYSDEVPCAAHVECAKNQYCYTTGRARSTTGFCEQCLECFKYQDPIDGSCPMCSDGNPGEIPSAQEEAANVQGGKLAPMLIVSIVAMAALGLVVYRGAKVRHHHRTFGADQINTGMSTNDFEGDIDLELEATPLIQPASQKDSIPSKLPEWE